MSGGQTGVDRAALDLALELDIPCGGWCPRGRLAEDGVIADRYPLRETASARYEERTVANVVDSDATLVLTSGQPTGGTAYTVETARVQGRPVLVIDVEAGRVSPATVVDWVMARGVQVLNVAGPRESTAPGIYTITREFLGHVLPLLREAR